MTSHPHHVSAHGVVGVNPARWDAKLLVQSGPTLPCSLITSHLDLEPQDLHCKSPQAQLLPTSTLSAPKNP